MANRNLVIILSIALYSIWNKGVAASGSFHTLIIGSQSDHSDNGLMTDKNPRFPRYFIHFTRLPSFMHLLELVKQAKVDGSDFRRQFVRVDDEGGEYFEITIVGYKHKTDVYLNGYRRQKDACLVGFKTNEDDTALVVPLNEDHLLRLLKLVLEGKKYAGYDIYKVPDHHKSVICDLWNSIVRTKFGIAENYDIGLILPARDRD